MKPLLYLVLFILMLTSCFENIDDFKKTEIHGVVDSVIVYNVQYPKDHFIKIKNKWYTFTFHYSDLFYYIKKGDSLYKAPGNWDIYVFRKIDDKVIKKHFNGAKGYLD